MNKKLPQSSEITKRFRELQGLRKMIQPRKRVMEKQQLMGIKLNFTHLNFLTGVRKI